jgi:hypothetical protein
MAATYVFIKKMDKDNEFDVSDVRLSLTSESLDDLTMEFACFLRACGFYLDGEFELLRNECSQCREWEKKEEARQEKAEARRMKKAKT